ncbi:MAG: DUF423 domain-containing protein [Wenzhouxiangella sp.]
MRNSVLIAGAVLGFLSVAIGASAEHVLQPRVSEEVFRWVMTAIRYHQVGALMVTAIGLALFAPLSAVRAARLRRSAWVFVLGTLLFSFSIYFAALTGIDKLTWATPVGGTTLMVAWLLLVLAALPAPDEARGAAGR